MSDIPESLLNLPTALVIQSGDGQRVATVQDLREFLLPLGLEIVSKDAVDWGTPYPHEATDINRICELDQQVELLQAERAALLAPSGRTPAQDQALLDAIDIALEGRPPPTDEEIQAVIGEWDLARDDLTAAPVPIEKKEAAE